MFWYMMYQLILATWQLQNIGGAHNNEGLLLVSGITEVLLMDHGWAYPRVWGLAGCPMGWGDLALLHMSLIVLHSPQWLHRPSLRARADDCLYHVSWPKLVTLGWGQSQDAEQATPPSVYWQCKLHGKGHGYGGSRELGPNITTHHVGFRGFTKNTLLHFVSTVCIFSSL